MGMFALDRILSIAEDTVKGKHTHFKGVLLGVNKNIFPGYSFCYRSEGFRRS